MSVFQAFWGGKRTSVILLEKKYIFEFEVAPTSNFEKSQIIENDPNLTVFYMGPYNGGMNETYQIFLPNLPFCPH